MELISAYADGETTESDTRQIREHLSTCESCSALLELYREISISTDESSVPAPEALRIGVMNRINNEETYHTANNTKRRRHFHIILTRYAPVAACLVVMLLVWQFRSNLFDVQHDAAVPAPAAAPLPAEDMAMFEPEAPDAAGRALDIEDSVINLDSEPQLEPESGDSNAAPPAEPTHEPALPAPMDVPVDTLEDFRLQEDEYWSAELTDRFFEYLGNASVTIYISGDDLPSLVSECSKYVIHPILSSATQIYEIPNTVVPALLAELGNREGVRIVERDNNSTYSVVYYYSRAR